MIVVVSRVGFLAIPVAAASYIDTHVIQDSVNETFSSLPSYAKKLLRWYAHLINGAQIIAGHIVEMEDLYPVIDKFEQLNDVKLSDEQVEHLEAQTEKMLSGETSDERKHDGTVPMNEGEIITDNSSEMQLLRNNIVIPLFSDEGEE